MQSIKPNWFSVNLWELLWCLEDLNCGLIHEVTQVDLFAHTLRRFSHINADINKYRKYLASFKCILFGQLISKILFHGITARIIMQSFKNLYIFWYFSYKRFAGPQSKLLNRTGMSCNLKIAKSSTTLSESNDTLKNQVVVDIQQWRGQWYNLLVVRKGFVQLTKANQFWKCLNYPTANSLVTDDRTLFFTVG